MVATSGNTSFVDNYSGRNGGKIKEAIIGKDSLILKRYVRS